jgi:hypothetical protein
MLETLVRQLRRSAPRGTPSRAYDARLQPCPTHPAEGGTCEPMQSEPWRCVYGEHAIGGGALSEVVAPLSQPLSLARGMEVLRRHVGDRARDVLSELLDGPLLPANRHPEADGTLVPRTLRGRMVHSQGLDRETYAKLVSVVSLAPHPFQTCIAYIPGIGSQEDVPALFIPEALWQGARDVLTSGGYRVREEPEALDTAKLRRGLASLLGEPRVEWEEADTVLKRLRKLLLVTAPVVSFVRRVLNAGREVETVLVRGEDCAILPGTEAREFVDAFAVAMPALEPFGPPIPQQDLHPCAYHNHPPGPCPFKKDTP